MPKILKVGLIALLLSILLVMFCYFYVDKPVAFFFHSSHLRQPRFFSLAFFTYLSKLIYITVIPFYLFFLIRFAYHRCKLIDYQLLTLVNSVVITTYIKDQLKFLFGRAWPETWINNNHSLFHDNVYGFYVLQGGSGSYASFPSGHTAIIVAAMSVLWRLYPRWRLLYIIAVALVVMGLIGMDYHFVSDVIAGGILGWYVAYCVVTISNTKKIIWKPIA